MNQIICTSDSNIDFKLNYYFKKSILKSISLFFTLSFFLLSIYFVVYIYKRSCFEKKSYTLINDFNLTNIYSNCSSSSISSNNIFSNLYTMSNNVIGIIEIKKIKITYPILSEISKDYLKISPCRFCGPSPNNIGNLCIAAHNYKNDTFFSKLSSLVNGDIITLYDLNGISVDYIVYDVYNVSSDDSYCTNQNTNEKKIVTLVTCNSLNNNYRTIVKAIEY